MAQHTTAAKEMRKFIASTREKTQGVGDYLGAAKNVAISQWRTSIRGESRIVRPSEQAARTLKCPGCFASLRSEQVAAPLAPAAIPAPA